MTCPYCETDPNQLNNHIRMSSDDAHGPQGTYPDDWDKDLRELVQDDDSDVDDPTGEANELVQDDDGDAASSDGDAIDPDELLDDKDDDASDYTCGNCGHGLDYLGGDDRDGGGKECPECEERLYWSMVDA